MANSNYPDDISYYKKDIPWNQPKLVQWLYDREAWCLCCDDRKKLNDEQICETCFETENCEHE